MYLWSFENGGLVPRTFSHTDVDDGETKEVIPGFADPVVSRSPASSYLEHRWNPSALPQA